MAVIAPKRKHIKDENIRQLQGFKWPLYRHVILDCPTDVPLDVIRPVAEDMAPHVENIQIEIGGYTYGSYPETIIKCLLSCDCVGSPRATRLKKLEINGCVYGGEALLGNQVLSALLTAPSLEELTLERVGFTSQDNIEEYFAGTTTLKTLNLAGCDTSDAVGCAARAFRKGLRRNQTLIKVSFGPTRDGPFLRESLMGIAENQHVQELSLRLHFSNPPTQQTLLALQGLMAGTTSIRKLYFGCYKRLLLPEILLGLASNTSCLEMDIEVRGSRVASADFDRADARLETVVRGFFAKNKALQICKLSGSGGLGFRSCMAFAECLSQVDSLKTFSAGGNTVSPYVLQHITRLQSASLENLYGPDWSMLSRSMESDQAGCNLQVLDLSKNRLTVRDVETVLPGLSRISELFIKDCDIAFESVRLLCGFIRNARQLKKLDLGFNPISTRGAASILETVSTSTSMKHLIMDGPKDSIPVPSSVNINQCHDSLRTLLLAADSQLVSLDLTHVGPLGLGAIRSIATGLRGNATLKTFKLPWFELEFISVLGEALTVNCSIESLEVNSCCASRDADGDVELGASEEEAVITFLGMLPHMKTLVSIKHLFDFEASAKIRQALIAALKENTVLKEIKKNVRAAQPEDHVCDSETVQFFLELNRLGRHNYPTPPSESKKRVPVGVLPHLFARMSQPEYTSHFHYFLSRTAPSDLLDEGQASSVGRKRRVMLPSLPDEAP